MQGADTALPAGDRDLMYSVISWPDYLKDTGSGMRGAKLAPVNFPQHTRLVVRLHDFAAKPLSYSARSGEYSWRSTEAEWYGSFRSGSETLRPLAPCHVIATR